ncbi:MAG: FAD-dependent oxidoreductase, partial [Aigarchaeota archaeon]|nr:FAD-dependent oxidoreductase [Aigarchaeota archaeon]
MTDFDVVVCGGGPAGLTAAWEACRRGCSALILEEHSSIGVPERCAGLLSLSGLSKLSLPLERRFTQNTVRGAVFFSPDGGSFTVDAGRPVAAVVSRKSFDQHLARRACKCAEL